MVARGARGLPVLLALLAVALALAPLAAVPLAVASGPVVERPSGVTGQVCVREVPDAGGDGRGCYGPGIPNAAIRLAGGGVDAQAGTDEWGRFRLDVPAGDYALTASHAGFETLEIRVAEEFFEVSLAPQKVTAHGRVAGGEGHAVANATVGFCCPPDGAPPSLTGADGSYSITLPAGAYGIEATAAGFAPYQARVFVDGAAPLDLALRPLPAQSGRIEGRVMDQDGRPVAGIAVAADQSHCCGEATRDGATRDDVWGRPADVLVSLRERTQTDAEGRYSVRVFPRGYVDLRVEDPGVSTQGVSVWVPDEAPVTQDLRVLRFPGRDAHVTGRVVDAATGRGIAGYSVSAEHLRFGLSECSEDARAARSGTATYAPPSYAPPPPSYGHPDVATYTVAPPYPPPYPEGRSDPGCAIRVQADGTFVADLVPGFTRLRAYASQQCTETQDAGGGFRRTCGPEYLPFVLSLDLPAGNTTGLVLRLPPRPAPDAVVSGYLVDAATQRALPLGHVEFSNEEIPGYGYATTDGDGSYRIRLRSGVHTVTARVGGYFEWQGTVVVPPGESPLDVLLAAGGPEKWGRPWDGGCCWDRPVPAPLECYDCAPHTYTATAMPAPPVPMGMPTMSAETAYGGGGDGAGGAVATGGSAVGAYADLGGSLGPYDPEARREVLDAAASDARGAPGFAAAVAGFGLVAALAAVRRRMD